MSLDYVINFRFLLSEKNGLEKETSENIPTSHFLLPFFTHFPLVTE